MKIDEGKSASAYRVLRDAIVAIELPPSSTLRIKELTKTYGFGWTPLREALSRLEAEALVVSERNRGYCVAPVTIASLEDLQQARFVIEKQLLEQAIEFGDEAWENAIIAAHYRLSKCVLPLDAQDQAAAEDWENRHVVFHDALLAASRSPWLTRMRNQIFLHVLRHHHALLLPKTDNGTLAKQREASLRQAMGIEHHTLLMNAVLERDAVRATALLQEHVSFTLQVFRAQYPATQD